MEFDHVLKIVGEFGPHQKRLYMLLCLSIIPAAVQLLILVFIAAEPTWICLGSSSNNTCPKNVSHCSKREYTSRFTSIITEWDLICEDSYKADLVQSVVMGGTLVGALFFGALADRYGRRKVWYITFSGLVAFAFASSFAPSYKLFVILRFFTGLCIGGEILTAFVLATELVGPTYRGLAGTMAMCFFTSGLLILPVVAYFIREWRTLTVVLSLPASVFILFFKWVPESARWLVIRGRVSEAEDILLDIALKNGIAIPKSLIQVNRPFHIGSRYGCLDLFCSRRIFKITIILILLWFINTLVYYGLSLNAKHLGGNIYMNFFLYSLMEIPAFLSCFCFINWIGRRKSVCCYMILAGGACLGCLFIQSSSNAEVTTTLTTVFAMLAKFGISASFAVVYIYSAELLPTVVRNVGMGVCSMSSRIAGICVPFVVYLGTYSKPLPVVIFGMCSFSAGLLSLALPETLNKPLPETLDDTKAFNENLRSGISYQQLEMSHLAFVRNEEVFEANDSDFDYDDDLVTEKTTFI